MIMRFMVPILVLFGINVAWAQSLPSPSFKTQPSADSSSFAETTAGVRTRGLPGVVSALLPEPGATQTQVVFDRGCVTNGGSNTHPAQWCYGTTTITDFAVLGRNGIDSCLGTDDTPSTTSSNISTLSTGGTGNITVGSTTAFATATVNYLFVHVGTEYMKGTIVDATTINITLRAQGFSSGVLHSNGSTLTLVNSMPACPSTAPPQADTAWYGYSMWCDNQTNPAFLWSQNESFGKVRIPTGCTLDYIAGLPIGFVYKASCNVAAGNPGIPPFTMTSWPGGASYYFQNTNLDGCYDVLAPTAGAGTATNNFADVISSYLGAGANCPNQFQRSALLNVRVTASTGAGAVYLRPNGDTLDTGELAALIGGSGQLAVPGAILTQLRAGSTHYTAGRFQWAASTGLTVGITSKGCGAVTQG